MPWRRWPDRRRCRTATFASLVAIGRGCAMARLGGVDGTLPGDMGIQLAKPYVSMVNNG